MIPSLARMNLPPVESTTVTSHISAAKLNEVAHQFEASLMQELMEPLQHDSMSTDDSGDNSGDHDANTDALGSFARESMAKALSAQGGFGIANSIVHYFEKSGQLK